MAKPVAHLLQKYGVAHRYWGQVIGEENQTLPSLLTQIKQVYADTDHSDPEYGFETFVDALIADEFEIISPSNMARWIYTDPIPATLNYWESSVQNAIILA